MSEFIVVSVEATDVLEKLRQHIDNMPELECPKHGPFRGYNQSQCGCCIDEVATQERQQAAIQRHLQLKFDSGIDERFIKCSFDNYEVTTAEQNQNLGRLKAYRGDCNVVMTGKVGNGKTHLATAIIDEFLKLGKSCQYVTYGDLTHISIKDEAKMNKLINCDFLVIDELGRTESNYKLELLTQLIDKRYRKLRFTMLVSNLNGDELKDRLDPSTYSRLKEECLSLIFTGADYRERGKK